MANLKITTVALGLGVVLLPLTALSTEHLSNQSASQSQEIQVSKNEWLSQVKQLVSKPICKGFMEDSQIAERFKQINLTYDKCVKEIPALTELCINEYQAEVPEQINQQAASKWGHKIGECIGNRFAKQYLVNQDNEGTSSTKTP